MTNREFYTAVIEADISAEMTEFAIASRAKLDERNAKRSSKPSKTALANEPIKEAIVKLLEEDADKTAAEIATALEISTQKASALCNQLTAEGLLIKTEIKIPKVGKRMAYAINDAPDVQALDGELDT